MIAPDGAALQPARILIVDDERHNRELIEVMLAPEGFDLTTAASGAEALAMVAEKPPDLILLDIMMPGMDGYQVASQLKTNRATKHIPIILVTALDNRDARMLGLNSGAEDFLTRPVDRAELCVRVRNLLRLKDYGDYYDKYSQMLECEVIARTADLVERSDALEKQTAVLSEQASLLDLAQDAIVVRDMHSRVVFWSRGAEVLYGWPSKEALGRITCDLLKTEFSEPSEEIENTLLRSGQWEGETVQRKRDGTRINVASRWTLQRDAGGVPLRVLTMSNDITSRKQGDLERLLSIERLSLATAVARVGVWEWDLASNMLTWDATMFDIYGLTPVVPMEYARWSAMVYADDLAGVEATLRKAIEDKGQGSAEFRIVRPDGTVRTVSAVERVVLDEHGQVSRVIGVNMDVTERKEAELVAEQHRQDAMRFQDEFLSHVSHELRSPLTAIKQFTSILIGGLAGELNKEQHQYEQIVMKNVAQLQSMIDDLLEVTRLETGKLTVSRECVSIAEAVIDSLHTLEMTAAAKNIGIACDLPAELPCIYADQTRLRQVLIILLDNAIKFTSDGGTVAVQARLLPNDPHFLQIDVADSGCGIQPEIADKIFDRLYQVSDRTQASRKGLGLGLYICKELVTRQEGQIWVERQTKRGTTFSFTLPVFSLSKLIAPLLKDGDWPAETLALVRVEVRLFDAWPSKDSKEQWSNEARDLLQRCLLPDLDVLLPNMSDASEGEQFLVAAFADEHGASVLANRIRVQFERHRNLKNAGTILVSYDMLQPILRDDGASVEGIVMRMATNLEDSIKSQTRSVVS